MLKKKIFAALTAMSMLAGTVTALASYTPKVHTGAVIDPLNTDDVFQYHFSGGTDAYMSGAVESGEKYDAYLWVDKATTKDNIKGLVAIKTNLIEVPLAYSRDLKDMLATKNFGILFIVDKNDKVPDTYTGTGQSYKNILQGMYTREDYKGDPLFTDAKYQTWDGKDAADIMNDIMQGIASASGYTAIADNTPVITIGHSAANPFGYRSGNWDYDRVIAQVQMKNGMWGDAKAAAGAEQSGMVPNIPSLQYAAQYTEHALGASRDRSVCDARYHIDRQRKVDTNQLVSHIIEWGSGHYDWSPGATAMMIKYIEKAIDCRLPSSFKGGNDSYTLNDLTSTGYLMKPFEKNGNTERDKGYYQANGWLSSGQNNAGATPADKQASFWYFDKEFADEVSDFTRYAIPESPGTNDTKVTGKTHSDYEPYMLIKNPADSTYADTPKSELNLIAPYASFNGGMSRYGSNRFVNYERMSNPSGNASNTANLQGYDTVTADTYYMNNVPSIEVSKDGQTYQAYDNVGDTAVVPENTKAEVIPLIAPYELIASEIIDMSGMTTDGTELAENVGAVTRSTLRFHNNRVYYNSGNDATAGDVVRGQDSFAMIYSPEVWNGNELVSVFKNTGIQMNVPYVKKGTDQNLTINNIPNVNIKDANADLTLDVSYTSKDSDLQKYTDVFVEYGPAKAVRKVDSTDGSYSWTVEILKNEIPVDATYPIEVSVVASNLGKWENVHGATAQTKFYITDKETKSGVYLDNIAQDNYDSAITSAISDNNAHTVEVYSDSNTSKRHDINASQNLTVVGGEFGKTVTQTSSNMMFLITGGATAPVFNLGNSTLTSTDKDSALTFNANGKKRFAELNKGTTNLYHGIIVTGGKESRGAGFDVKTGSVLNMYGGIIKDGSVTDANNLGGGGVSVVGWGTFNMSGGTITQNTSQLSFGGGVSVMENGTFNMSGGKIFGNTGYDVYVNNNNFKMSGSASAGEVYLNGRVINVVAPFTVSGAHANIIPSAYAEGTTVAKYADSVTPSTMDFTIAPNDGTPWYTYIDGQELKLTSVAPHKITATNVSVQNIASKGETVVVTVPDKYVANSLVVSGVNPSTFKKVSDTQYSFTMPDKDVSVSCLVNNTDKVMVIGVHDSYYVKNDNNINVSFTVPAAPKGYKYVNPTVSVPVRANYNSSYTMSAAMNGEEYAMSDGSVIGTGTVINDGINTLTITSDGGNGVDYYSYRGGWNGSGYDYPLSADNLSTLTLTLSKTAEITDEAAEYQEGTLTLSAKANIPEDDTELYSHYGFILVNFSDPATKDDGDMPINSISGKDIAVDTGEALLNGSTFELKITGADKAKGMGFYAIPYMNNIWGNPFTSLADWGN
ncbi:MAG: hypothetical protein IJT23_07290 [Clostridia bacterium]|nr:hypothetical protein [Clostridia bacterium]